mgnify:CR=1 FL=1
MSPVLNNPSSWKVIDLVIATIMFAIAGVIIGPHIQNIVEYTVNIECTLRFLKYIQSVLEYIQSVIRGHCLGMLWVRILEKTRVY